MSKSFIALDPQQKGKPYVSALIKAGWHQYDPTDWQAVDLLMLNHDHPISNYRSAIDYQADAGGKVVIFPDGFNPSVEWDSIHLPYRNDAVLLISEGHREVLQLWDHPVPMHVTGWPWTPVCDFQPTTGRRVLFAPVHPDGNGYLHPDEITRNRAIYRALLEQDISLTVRYLGQLAQNGLWVEDGVTFRVGEYDNTNRDIHAADVVIASGTYAAMACALGKPLVMFEQSMPHTPHYDDYMPLLSYPLLWEADADMEELLSVARQPSPAVAAWRDKFIGAEMQAENVVSVIEEICSDG